MANEVKDKELEMKDETPKKIPIYNITVNECTEEYCDMTETNFISLVTTPAIEVDFLAFSEDSSIKKHSFKIQDESKKMLIGPLMICDLPIYRKNPDTGEEYYVQFGAEAIENSIKNWAKKGYNHNINMQHDTPVDGAYLMEVWTVIDPKKDKSASYNFKGITPNSAMGIVYVPNQKVWDEYIKTGILKGFSVEGMYEQASTPIAYFNSQKENLEESLTEEDKGLILEISTILLNSKI